MGPDELMDEAIKAAREGIEKGESPFGCAIALNNRVIACRHNTVLSRTDITAHAEINALRAACRDQKKLLLEGFEVASTCEPCPMCMAALHWARVKVVYFGASIDDARSAGFNELRIPARDIVQLGSSPVRVVNGIRRESCCDLFTQWSARDDCQPY